jgi:branched-chain amino acid transport system permease protein
MHFLDAFGVYDFAVRSALILTLVACAVYVLLNAGIFAVPQVGLMAIGAYTSTILSLDAHWSVPLSIACGALAGLAAGLVLAGLLGRLNGIYLAIATIAFSEAVGAAVLNIPGTGAAQGRVGIPREVSDFQIVAAVLIALAVLWLINRSRYGLAIVALREDTLMAKHQGIDVYSYRVALFGLAGLLSGLAGGLNVHFTGYIEPGFFSFDLLTQLLAAVVVGGMIYVAGPLVGVAVIFALPQIVSNLGDYQVLANGAIIVIVVAFAPYGLIGYVMGVVHRTRRARLTGDEDQAGKGTAVHSLRKRSPLPTEECLPIIELNDIAVNFGGIKALRRVSMSCAKGQLLGIIGPNGSGKTTLLNVISGAYSPSSGSGFLLGKSLDGVWGQPHKLARLGVSRTFQTIRLVDSHSVQENVMVGLHGLGDKRRSDDSKAADTISRSEIVMRILKEHGLAQFADVKAGELSYGVRRRVEIARAVASRPNLLLLDEPTAGMDPQERAEVFEMISAVLAEGIAIIVVEHDVALMGQYCDRLIVLDFGEILASGDPMHVLQQEEVINAYIGTSASKDASSTTYERVTR